MIASVKYSTNYRAVENRLKNLPHLMPGFLEAHAMKYAVRFIKIWQDGLKKNDFGLIPLKEETVKAKANMSFLKGRGRGKAKAEIPYKKPGTPLYGAGLDIDLKTYINMLRIFKKSKLYKVMPSWAKHHKSSLKLKDLFDIHEKGRTIIKPDGTAIRIPPRPALFLAYRRFLNEKRQQDPAKKFKQEVGKYLKTGTSKYFDDVLKSKSEGDKYKDK
jgi:hypothetical protein